MNKVHGDSNQRLNVLPIELRGPSVRTRVAGALAAVVVTLGLLQSLSALFMSVPANQLAKASSAQVMVANAR